MITIIDYGMGNLSSIQNMLRRLGYSAVITSDENEISRAEKLILPGVGAFDNGMIEIRKRGLEYIIKKRVLDDHIPILGICLGMQLLFDSSEEGQERGLALLRGRGVRFRMEDLGTNQKIPHMGWNTVEIKRESAITNNFLEEMKFYFVHSYHVVCSCPEDICLTTDYGGEIIAAVAKENIFGCQFHPEKSHKYGMIVLRNFSEM